MATYSRIKQFGDLVAQANMLGKTDIKLDRVMATELLSEITKLAVERTEQLDKPVPKPVLSTLSGGRFK